MQTKYGFTKMTLAEFDTWIQQQRIARTLLNVQQHHTWNPNYSHFNGSNHFERQLAMKNHHVGNNGWADIGQHFTIFPDGMILTGRPLEKIPACIYGNNSHSICMEHFGNFDIGGDNMTDSQRQTIVQMTAMLLKKFNLPVNTNSILYHHWFDLSSGVRNNGTRNNKSCPGTNFFGGNKVENAIAGFLPLVQQALGNRPVQAPVANINKYVIVTASRLNIRQQPTGSAPLATDRDAAQMGAVLRINGESNGWLKISNSQAHWVYGKYTTEVLRATVNANVLRVRSGPGVGYSIIGTLPKSEEVFLVDIKNGWCKIGMEEKWVSKDFLQAI
jgi:hypothetical protein